MSHRTVANWLDFLDCAYDFDAPDTEWMTRLMQAMQRAVGGELGAYGFVYDASRPARMRIVRLESTNDAPPIDSADFIRGIQLAGGKEYVEATYRAIHCGTATETSGFAGSAAEAFLNSLGIADILGINGLEPDGLGVWLGCATRERTELPHDARATHTRISCHLAAAYRLRRRMKPVAIRNRLPAWAADAVLSPDGRLEYAAPEAIEVQQHHKRLRDAAVAITRARDTMNGAAKSVRQDVLSQWTPSVDGQKAQHSMIEPLPTLQPSASNVLLFTRRDARIQQRVHAVLCAEMIKRC